MAEYIKREATLAILRKNPTGTWRGLPVYSDDIKAAIHEIESLPSNDVAPVVHGRWKTKRGNYITGGGSPLWCCSNCGYVVAASLLPPKYNHCASCGAKMEEAR